MHTVALLHGAGYVGGTLVRLLQAHPAVHVQTVTSRTFAGQPLHAAHPALRGVTDLRFTAPEAFDPESAAAVVVAAEHGRGMAVVAALLQQGYAGAIVDMSADFRFRDAATYQAWYDAPHTAPALLEQFAYGVPELQAPYATPYVANPGCFATGLRLALAPLASQLPTLRVAATALTGASGSGATPSATTHFPTRSGNVRAYRTFRHRHLPEVLQGLDGSVDLAFSPASGPWTHGIWGTLHVHAPGGLSEETLTAWFEAAYAEAPLIRRYPGHLPELQPVVGSPFCDVGWVVEGGHAAIGFALDNLMKGAASQAVQNLNLLLGLPETAGLLSNTSITPVPTHSPTIAL
ncbi:MAG: N-acetyl-gamma-glutamyl-phosphate reductase [Bacteroidetes bacterium]|jgi:N-acetyl-gamma-glutamyl-phosphate reductase|nr:N-acetyl-gamma-glutamyl-phosphate reductase [Bacteroidota bacterium]